MRVRQVTKPYRTPEQTAKARDALEELVYKANDPSLRETARETASRALAPDLYNDGPHIADALTSLWEPHLREACELLRSPGDGRDVERFLRRMDDLLPDNNRTGA